MDLFDPVALLRAEGIDLASKPAPPPVPIINKCATCHRRNTLLLAGDAELKRREWLCEKYGCVATDGDLNQLVCEYLHNPGAMVGLPPVLPGILSVPFKRQTHP